MIRKIADADFPAIYKIINDAAAAYKGKIPMDCYHEPYMPQEELREEIRSGVQFFGIKVDGEVAAVMGIQRVQDVTLIRHAYTLTRYQRRGLGEQLLNFLLDLADTDRILVGTWQDTPWAIRFYQKYGFKIQSRAETNKLLKQYWNIPKQQLENSIVLEQRRRQ